MSLRSRVRGAFGAHPEALFIFGAYAWTWSWVLMAALTRVGRLDLPMKGDLGVLLARFGPSLAAVACLGLAWGAPAVARLLSRLAEVRIGLAWLAFALGMDLVLYVIVLVVGSHLDPRMPRLDGQLLSNLPEGWPSAFLASFLTSGIGEELGWRGLLLPLLLRRMRPLTATLLMVPIVSLWHLNTGFLARGLQEGLPAFLGAYLPDMAGRFALTLPSLCIFTLLFLRNRGSLLLMAAVHAATNASYDWADACVGPAKPPVFWGLYGALLGGVGLWAAVQLWRMPQGLVVDPADGSLTDPGTPRS